MCNVCTSQIHRVGSSQDLLRTADRHGLVKAGLGGTTATLVVHDRAEQKLQAAFSGCPPANILGIMGIYGEYMGNI